jgi:hypothetical protein
VTAIDGGSITLALITTPGGGTAGGRQQGPEAWAR